jgi:hypothetical protein
MSHPGSNRAPHTSSTPLYDDLVAEYRLALRSVPGDQGTEDRFPVSVLHQEYGFVPMARRGSSHFPRPTSRHRGASADAQSF